MQQPACDHTGATGGSGDGPSTFWEGPCGAALRVNSRRAQSRLFNIASWQRLALLATCTTGCSVVSNLPAPVAYSQRILGGDVCLENGGTGRILSRWRMHRRRRLCAASHLILLPLNSSASRFYGLKLYTMAVHLEKSQDCFYAATRTARNSNSSRHDVGSTGGLVYPRILELERMTGRTHGRHAYLRFTAQQFRGRGLFCLASAILAL